MKAGVAQMYNPQLDTFIQVANSGSFTKAAEVLYITPTVVIKQMNVDDCGARQLSGGRYSSHCRGELRWYKSN